MKVLVAVVLVALLGIQATTQVPLEDDSAKTVLVDVLTKIFDVVEPILDEAQSLAEKLDSDPDTVSSKVISIVSGLAEKLNALILEGVNKLSDDASDDANKVIDCINEQQENTNAALEDTITKATDCISETYSQIYETTNLVLNDLVDLEQDVKDKVATLSECTSSDLICIYNFGVSLYNITTVVAEKLPTDVVGIVDVAKVVVTQLKSCQLSPGIKENAETILDNAAKCIINA